MGWLNAIGGLLGGGVAKVGEIFFGNEAKRDEYAASENAAAMQQFAAEFLPRENRTAFDSLVDGMNRLMRPSMWFSTIGLFWIAPIDPVKFTEITAALALVPEGMWMLLAIMVGFLFPSRLLEKGMQKDITKGFGLQAAKDRIEMAAELKKIIGTDDDADEALQTDNDSINQWRKRNGMG